ncbi:TPA: hypothetical protein ROY30_005595 [Bacillus cereus]|uniref:head fiber protein n=1 Tax=Bacillales TaxID=1385 RepID=UPI001C309A2E|nr:MULTISPECIES: head fiber protein [Bacillales]MCP1284030.1 head fiber protein [Bacillus sp. S0635]MCQ6349677.1 head fiber protein [Bacillus cereus]HDX9631826.1 hypothetical protein [Bacillus cereus]
MAISENQAQRLNKSMPIAKEIKLGSVIKDLQEKADKKVTTQANSTATDVPGLVADFNALLAKLKAAGVMG